MNIYDIFDKDGSKINRIVATEDFIDEYCSQYGYSYEFDGETADPEPPIDSHREPTTEDRISATESAILALMTGGITNV